MSKHGWYCSLIALSLVLLAGSAGGCALATSPEESASPAGVPASISKADSIANSIEANTTTGTDTVKVTPDDTSGEPADKTLIGCDPVSGRAQEVNLCWEQLCVADAYDIEIAKDADFTLRIIDFTEEGNSGVLAYLCHAMRPVDVLKPCVFFPAGGAAMSEFLKGQVGKIEIPFPLLDEMIGTELGQLRMSTPSLAAFANLECGHTYYWRVKARRCATGQWARSPWSEVMSFTIKAGLPVTTPYYGPQLLAPDNGCLTCPVKPASFSWSPFKETTKYKFQLAKDAAMTQIVKETDITTTAYEYDGTLDYSSSYFWRIMALEPAPSDWSATFSFQTQEAPPPPAEPEGPPPTPLWAWVIIAIGAILMIVTLVLVFKTRRV